MMKSCLLFTLGLCATAHAGDVTLSNSTAEYARLVFNDGGYVGSVVCGPQSTASAVVNVPGDVWTAKLQTSADGAAYLDVPGAVVTGISDFVAHSSLTVSVGSTFEFRLYEPDETVLLGAFLTGFVVPLPLFGLLLSVAAVRKGLRLGTEGSL